MTQTDEPFGAYRLDAWRALVRRAMVALPSGFLGKQARSIARRGDARGRHGPVDIDDFHGARMRLHHGDNFADKFILGLGENYDRAERDALARGLARAWESEREPVFVDLGANNGGYSLYLADLARRAGKRLRIIAIEPDATNRARLEFNIAASGWADTITVDARAASHLREHVVLQGEANNRGGLRALSADAARQHPARGETVQALPLREILAAHGGTVSVLKVDIEGRDLAVLEQFFESGDPDDLPGMVLAETWDGDRARMQALFARHGYAIEADLGDNLVGRRDAGRVDTGALLRI